MNIGILTHYTVINQGAILQMYALKAWLEKKGHTVYFLTYTKDFDFAPDERGKYNISLRYIPFYIKEYLIKKGLGLTLFNVEKQILYKKYIKEHFAFKSYALSKMDMVIIGSDEVFSLAVGCNKMMYGHGVNANHIASYAPSFGQTDMTRIKEFNCERLISSGLQMLDYISVRDEHSAEIVKKLVGRKPEIVCDPVMLFDFSDTHTDISKFKLSNKEYLLVYSMDRWMVDSEEVSAIKNYARKRGLITVSAGTYHAWCDRNIVCNPIEWLEIFRGATEVVTDTFHGSVLSIITNKQTTYYIRDLNTKKISDLLSKFDLSDRVVPSLTEANIEATMLKETDFSKVNSVLRDFREHSETYLQNCLSGEQNE